MMRVPCPATGTCLCLSHFEWMPSFLQKVNMYFALQVLLQARENAKQQQQQGITPGGRWKSCVLFSYSSSYFLLFFFVVFKKNIYISFSNCPYRDTQENRLFSLAAVIAQLSGASCSTYKSLACPLVGRSHFFKHHLSIVFLSTLFHRTRRMAL